MRAHEPPDEPVERTAQRSTDALADVLQHFLFRTRFARKSDRERRDLLRIHTSTHLKTIPGATLEILRRDRVGVEVASGDEMKRAAHETRADHLAAFYRRPELLAAEVFEARPERDVWRGGPLRLQRREPLDRRDNADP